MSLSLTANPLLGTVPPRVLSPYPDESSEGALSGIKINPREIAAAAYEIGPRWRDAKVLVVAVAVALAESQGYSKAHCDNFQDALDGERTLLSRDCGVWQINIPSPCVGTEREEMLYDLRANAHAAYELFIRRLWQPWVAFNTGVYLHDSYRLRAETGVANFLNDHLGELAQRAGVESVVRTPAISLKELKHLYPGVKLG